MVGPAGFEPCNLSLIRRTLSPTELRARKPLCRYASRVAVADQDPDELSGGLHARNLSTTAQERQGLRGHGFLTMCTSAFLWITSPIVEPRAWPTRTRMSHSEKETGLGRTRRGV